MSFELFLQGYDPAMSMAYTGGGAAPVNAWDLGVASAEYFKAPSQVAYKNAYNRANANNRLVLGNGVLNAIRAAAAPAVPPPIPGPVLQFSQASLQPVNLLMIPAKRAAYTLAMNTLATNMRNAAILRFPIEATQGANGGIANFSDFFTYCTHAIGNADAPTGSSEDVRGFCTGLAAIANHFRANWGGNFNLNNGNKKTANTMQDDVNAIVQQCNAHAAVMEATLGGNMKQRWDRVKGQSATYWQDEVPAYRARRAHLLNLRAARNAGQPAVWVYRHVTDGEANDVIGNSVLRQGPQTLETEKWFTTNVNQVGNGVMHGRLLEIELKPGAFTALTGAAGNTAANAIAAYSGANAAGQAWATQRTAHDWANHLVLLKPNEAPSFGIHEDALGVFNEFVNQVRVKQAVNAQQFQTVNINFAQCNYPVV